LKQMARNTPLSVKLRALLRHPLKGRKRRDYRLRWNSSVGEPNRRFLPSVKQRLTPHITVVAMARNKVSRVHDTMRHFCALFDRVVLIDHLAEERTADIAQGYNGVADTEVIVLRSQYSGCCQSEYMSAVANALLAERRTDWIFFLDFGEFLDFDDASAFRQALVDLSMEPVICGHLRNLALAGQAGDSLQGAEVVVGPKVSGRVKVALNARIIEPDVTIVEGNHAVRRHDHNADETGVRAFALMHVPFLGQEFLRRNVAQGPKPLQGTGGKPVNHGFHWRDMQEHIDSIVENGDLAREVALNYGKPVVEIIRSVAEGKRTEGVRPHTLRFAQSPSAVPAAADHIPIFSSQTFKHVLSKKFPPQATPDPLAGLETALYARLLERSAPGALDMRCQIDDALMAASTDVEVVVPTAWMGHIPFLFSLMEMQRPRRYVELGTHAGASFFAACQHMRSNGGYGEAVAIDLWHGDHQAGFYGEEVFENFKFILERNFRTTGRFIRGYFSDAVSCFEDGSIDLLHIDGLHTYEAVKEDYETWRPKLASDGVIIFHDTNEYQTDFGVWQFFDEVRLEAPSSFQFRHCHGLGVMAFGTPETNPVLELLAYFRRRPEKIESFYATLGNALWHAASARHAKI
jgi:predicted O-methyltransferase YrrM